MVNDQYILNKRFSKGEDWIIISKVMHMIKSLYTEYTNRNGSLKKNI